MRASIYRPLFLLVDPSLREGCPGQGLSSMAAHSIRLKLRFDRQPARPQYLLDHGADHLAGRDDGLTVLHHAARKGTTNNATPTTIDVSLFFWDQGPDVLGFIYGLYSTSECLPSVYCSLSIYYSTSDVLDFTMILSYPYTAR
ncbi:hypothetical protein ZWY2020_026644 [Hordeum vulgare]|nr:hypothetical protein ZWY2020_026644 [Hordeum vulgare]